MVIYGEYLFLENFVTGVILLIITGRFLGIRLRRGRILLGGILCGIGGFSIFCNWPVVHGIGMRVLIGTLVVLATFGDRKLTAILKETGVFILLTFLSGGAAMAILIWCKEPVLYGNGAFYMAEVTYIRLLVIGGPIFGGCCWAVHMIKERRIEKAITGDVHIKIGDKEFIFSGYLDSGNHLRDPVSKKPVILIDRVGQRAIRELWEDKQGLMGIPKERLVSIPYKAIGTDKGLLWGFRTDCVTFKNTTVKGATVGLYNGNFNGYQALVGKDFIDHV